MYFGVRRTKSKESLNWNIPLYSLKCIGHVRGQPAGIPWRHAGSMHDTLLEVTLCTWLSEHYSPNTQLPSLGEVTMNKEDSNNINTTIQSQWNSGQVNLLTFTSEALMHPQVFGMDEVCDWGLQRQPFPDEKGQSVQFLSIHHESMLNNGSYGVLFCKCLLTFASW